MFSLSLPSGRSSPAAIILVATISLVSHAATFPEISPDTNPVIPYRGLTYTADDILEVRRQVRDHGANAGLVEDILKTAREWTARSDAEVAVLVPPSGSVFAYGTTGDPKNGKPWPRFARSGDMCSLDRPGEVRSPHTGDVYGTQKPGEPFYDPGTGWVRPKDGQVFYFRGLWNSWVTGQLHDAVDNLALAYLLTGDGAFSRRALFILDRLATLRVQLPVRGYAVADWPHATDDDQVKGFFHYMGNIANQRVINTALAFDLIANAPFASEPSAGDATLSVRDNISKNYFDIYERAYLETRQLTNHALILLGNLITQGVLFGKPDLLREGIDGLHAFLDNTTHRDGDYVEVSGSYGRLGRDYGGRLIAVLANYDPENYPGISGMPDPKEYPHALRFGDDPRWYGNAVRMLYRLPVLGRYPQYGDMTMDRNVLIDRDNEWLARHRVQYLRMLWRQTTREDWKREIEALYPHAAKQKQAPVFLEDLLLYGLSQWVEPTPAEPAPERPETGIPAGETSDLMPGKGIAILRSGEGVNRRALFMRGGINSYHGHDDQMALVPYGNGMVLTGEYGYQWSGTPDHLGWGTRSVAHMTTVVDEDLPAPYLYKGFSPSIPAPAASITGFLPNPRGPAQFVEMRNPQLYARARLTDYRRTAWLVDVDPERYYFVDIFRVVGGKSHDYVWNSHYAARSNRAAFQVDGIKPVATEGVWTLAALSGANRDKSWNRPGQSWGERLNASAGRIEALPGEKPLPRSKWNPEPGNGYGMIWDVKSQVTGNDWQATWLLPDGRHFARASLLNYDGMTAVTALAPSVQQQNPFNIVIARRTREANAAGSTVLQSRFVNVVEVGGPGAWEVAKTERLPLKTTGLAADAVALKLQLANGSTDYLLSSRAADQTLDGGTVRLAGRNGFARLAPDGRLTALAMQEAVRMEAGGWVVEAAAPAFQARVVSAEPGEPESRLVIDGRLPEGGALAGATVLIDSAPGARIAYSHNDYYSVETVEHGNTLVFRGQSLVAATLQVDTVKAASSQVELYWNNELGGKPGSFSYQGRGVIPAGAAPPRPLAQIKKFNNRELDLTSVSALKTGQKLQVLVAQPGDVLTIPATVTLTRAGTGHDWFLRTTAPVRLTLPGEKTPRSFAAGEHVLRVES
ncbi:Heparinase II/III-like protein [Opitutaceae bacterium TAV1]|nr:Heparinase II/III-like protein [Opitutaceae bacterium TAV1]